MEALKNAFDFSDFPRIDLTIAALAALFLLTFPVFPHSSFAMATMIQFLMFSLYGMGWNTIGGYGGQVDLGKAQYVGIGAFTTSVMLIRWNVPFWVSMPMGRYLLLLCHPGFFLPWYYVCQLVPQIALGVSAPVH
jgi:branched-chain amino acid transport system permease protein